MSKTNIGELITDLLKVEGGQTDDPTDSGGRTKFGISKKAFPHLNIFDITEDQARDIYKDRYFRGPGFDKLPAEIQAAMFDYGVNSGPAIATKALQRVVGVNADGALGPMTLAQVATFPPADLLLGVTRERSRMLCNLVQRRPKDVKFVEGWIMRALSFL